jgi:hypothetical protein
MDSDERDIFNYLKTWGKVYVGVREICRRAGSKQRFRDDPDWAKPFLQVMMERGVLERDHSGRYRIMPKKKNGREARWVSPHIAELLKEKGVEMDNRAEEPNLDDFEQT